MKDCHAHRQEVGYEVQCDQCYRYAVGSTLRDAQGAFGQLFFGIDEYARWFPDLLARAAYQDIGPFPWPASVITRPCPFVPGRSIAETHLAFLGLEQVGGEPLSFDRWKSVTPELFRPVPCSSDPHVTARTCMPRWYLMPLHAPGAEQGRSYDERLAALPQEYEQASVIEEATKRILLATVASEGLAPQQSIAFCADSLPKPPGCGLQLLPAVGLWENYVIDLKYLPRQSRWRESFGLSAMRKQPGR